MDSDAPDAIANSIATPGKKFHGWRLLGVLALVILATAAVSAFVDLWVIPR